MNETTHRMRLVQDPVIPIVGRWTAEHPGTISLGQGVVHYGPPSEVAQVVSEACQNRVEPLHGYADVAGGHELRQAIARKLVSENQFGNNVSRRIVCTAGSNMGFLNAILAIADVGDEVILLSPFYFNHDMAIRIAGCKTVAAPTTDDYQIDLAALEQSISPRTRAIVTVSPNNPTGAIYRRTDLEAVNALCRSNGIFHISDEAYEYFTYEQFQHFSPGSLAAAEEHTISLFSLSKSYGMAGWRTGYMVVPESLLLSIRKIQDTNLICPPLVCQKAALAALEVGGEYCREQSREFASVRDATYDRLSELGGFCRVPRPGGAFYFLIDLDCSVDEMQLVEALIRDYGVAVLPGSAFRDAESTPRCQLRISYGALQRHTVLEGVGRLCDGLTKLVAQRN